MGLGTDIAVLVAVATAAVMATLAIYRLGYRDGLKVAEYRVRIEKGLPAIESLPAKEAEIDMTDDEAVKRKFETR